MCYSIAHHMKQRVSKRREHVRVQANVTSKRFEDHFFPERLSGVPNRPFERREDSLCRKQTQAIGCIAHLRKFGCDLPGPGCYVALETLKLAAKFLDQRPGLYGSG